MRISTEKRYTSFVQNHKAELQSSECLEDGNEPKNLGSVISNSIMFQIQQTLICASAMFLFNKLKNSVDLVIAGWHLALQNKNFSLSVLPKTVINQEYRFLLFASLFMMRGYAESLIVSQFLENIFEIRKLQRYILQFINYFPRHLIEFLFSPSTIEEIMSKNMKMVKGDCAEKTLVNSISGSLII